MEPFSIRLFFSHPLPSEWKWYLRNWRHAYSIVPLKKWSFYPGSTNNSLFWVPKRNLITLFHFAPISWQNKLKSYDWAFFKYIYEIFRARPTRTSWFQSFKKESGNNKRSIVLGPPDTLEDCKWVKFQRISHISVMYIDQKLHKKTYLIYLAHFVWEQ